jgi:CRISPR-associated protein Csd1
MLKSLYDYALRHELALPAGCVNKTVKAYLSLSAQSDYAGVIMGDAEPVPCPDIGSLANGTKLSNVIVEKRSVVLPEEPSAKSAFFLSALRDAAEAVPECAVCVAALENAETREKLRQELDRNKVKPTDRISFAVDGLPIVRNDALLAWWETYRKQFAKQDAANQTRCLITGEPTAPLATTPSIQGLRAVGGHSSGDALICFDKAAFTSYGLKQGANAPVSEETFSAVKAALDSLLKSAPILAGMKFVHWYDADIQPEDDPFQTSPDFGDWDLGDDEEETPAERQRKERAENDKATQLVNSVRSGERDVVLGKVRYHILLLSGVGGRVMVRRYEQGDYKQLQTALARWNSDLALTNASGTQLLPGCKLTARLLRLLKYQKSDSKPFERLSKELSGVTPTILQSILTGAPLPDSVAVRSLQAIRSQMLSDEEDSGRLFYGLGLSCQWLKAWLIRNQNKGDVMMSAYNPENHSPAYQCGAILAIYEKIQSAAYPDVNVSVVQRYYASAIQTPALVIGRLSQLSVHHLKELDKTAPKLCGYFSRLLANTYAAIDGAIPTTLTLPEQAEFALGYYQMQAYRKKED